MVTVRGGDTTCTKHTLNTSALNPICVFFVLWEGTRVCILKYRIHNRIKATSVNLTKGQAIMPDEELFLNLQLNIFYSLILRSKSVSLRLKNRFNRNSLTYFYMSHFTRWLSLYILLPGSDVILHHFIGFDKYLKFYFILLTVELLSVTCKIAKLRLFLFHTLQKRNRNLHLLIVNVTGGKHSVH